MTTNVALLIGAGAFALALLIVLIAKVGPDAFVRLWTALPVRARSILNVAIAGALAFGGGALLDLLSGPNVPTWVKLGGTAVLTPVVRQLNSADPYPGNVIQGDVIGAHEATDPTTTAEGQ